MRKGDMETLRFSIDLAMMAFDKELQYKTGEARLNYILHILTEIQRMMGVIPPNNKFILERLLSCANIFTSLAKKDHLDCFRNYGVYFERR